MTTNSFDLPYAPFAEACRSIFRVFAIAAALGLLLWAGFAFANRWGPFSPRAGETRVGIGVTGAVGGGIRLQVQNLHVQCSGETGVLYSAQSYFNEEGQAHIMVTRTEMDDEGKRGASKSWRVPSEPGTE